MALRFSSWKVSLFRIVKSVSKQDSVGRERGREGGRERERGNMDLPTVRENFLFAFKNYIWVVLVLILI